MNESVVWPNFQTTQALIDAVSEHLKHTLQASHVHLHDFSEQHKGHAQAAFHGGAHLHLEISSPLFAQGTRVQHHQMIYAALTGLMEREIHALSIEIKKQE